MVPADGWSETGRGDSYVALEDGASVFYGEAFYPGGVGPAGEEITGYLEFLTEDATDVRMGDVTTLDLGAGLDAATQTAQWTVSDSSGSYESAVTTTM